MPTNVVMPQMGESIFEGTITKWLKKAGETVQRDEPLFEISTDKVDAEIPSPASGVLTEIKIAEGATVQINTVVAVIGENGNAAASNSGATVDAKKEAKQEAVATAPEKANEPVPQPAATKQEAEPVPAPAATKSEPAPAPSAPAPTQNTGGTDVVMPQMGESIFEGTITKWLKKVGDAVARDEPLFEISTDKVDAEIPSPASGVLTEIKIAEGATVEINTVVAVIAENGNAAASNSGATVDAKKEAKQEAVATAPEKANEPVPQPAANKQEPVPPPAAAKSEPAPPPPSANASAPAPTQNTGGTNVVMPQMGESIFEGTITKWLKKVGDSVARDEPLFEISTDKVDAEIPSPAAGVLTDIKVPEGSTVEINTIVAVIGGTAGATTPAPAATAPTASEKKTVPTPQPSVAPAASAPAPQPGAATTAASTGERQRSSPLVRRIAKENNLDLSQVPGTGAGGRITKEDALAYVGQRGNTPATAAATSQAASAPSVAPSIAASVPAEVSIPGDLVPLSKMRSIIAQRMVESKHTSAHVHSVFKIDMTRIVKIREREKSKYEQRNGVKLTYMPFVTSAVVSCLRKMPIVNASMEGNAIRYHKHINVGIAVALDWGLIVPVIKNAEERSFLGIARAIADLAARARGKKLKPEEVAEGTFTITNPGIFGEQFGTPVINQPETAILGVGGLFKEPTVVTDADGNDSIAVRHIMRLTLGFDHRIIDGADAGKFMAELKKTLENWDGDIG